MLHSPPKLSRDAAEPAQPDKMDVSGEDKEKPELVGDATNEQDAVPDHPPITNEKHHKDTHAEGEKKTEDRGHDDHGGEELVEGQEDDVIY